jgi:DNA repair protein RecO (recombination protein O)
MRAGPAANGPAPAWLWRTLTYFSLWSLRLSGWLPPLDVCLETGAAIGPDETAWYERGADGLLCAAARGPNSWPLAPESRAIARRMLRASLADLPDEPWRRETAADLRRFLDQRLEAHFEKRLKTLAQLNGL